MGMVVPPMCPSVLVVGTEQIGCRRYLRGAGAEKEGKPEGNYHGD
jgi:hypothetical protein